VTTPVDSSVAPPSIGTAAGDACPSCGASMAPDQRYCLNCGTRRGDPRLPFMDAVVFMEAGKQPHGEAVTAAVAPPPPPQKSGMSAGTTLIAGIATLILAVGVGVLIGRGGDNSAPQVASPKPTVIQVGGSGNGEAETASETTAGTKKDASRGASKSKGGEKKTKKAPPEKEVDSSGTSKAAAEVLKPSGDVKLPPPTTKVGEKCEKGTSGCSDSGEFNGDFFGE